MPSKLDIESIDSPHAQKIIASLPPIERPDIWSMFPSMPDDALDLM